MSKYHDLRLLVLGLDCCLVYHLSIRKKMHSTNLWVGKSFCSFMLVLQSINSFCYGLFLLSLAFAVFVPGLLLVESICFDSR